MGKVFEIVEQVASGAVQVEFLGFLVRQFAQVAAT